MTEGPTPSDPREEPPRAPAGRPDAPVEQPPPAYPPADNPPGSDAPRWESPGTPPPPPPPPPSGGQGWAQPSGDPQQPGGYPTQGSYPPPPGGYPPQGGYPQQPGGPYPGPYPGQPAGGMAENVASGLSYVLTWLTGLIFFLVDKRPEVRFHAMQAIAFGVLWTLVGVVGSRLPGPLGLLFSLVWLAFLIGWVYLLVQGFQGRHYKLPVLGDFAEQQANQPRP
jgi:uncharacterized membrane protein